MIKNNQVELKAINDGTNKFIQISFENTEVEEFEVNYINSNKGKGLIEVEKAILNSNVTLKYCVTDLKSLTDFINGRDNTKEELMKILTNISMVLVSCDFLKNNKFIIDKNLIFINSTDLSISMIYLPLVEEYTEDVSRSYLDMVYEITNEIITSGDIKRGSGDFLIELKKKSKEDNITIIELLEYMKNQIDVKVNSPNRNQKQSNLASNRKINNQSSNQKLNNENSNRHIEKNLSSLGKQSTHQDKKISSNVTPNISGNINKQMDNKSSTVEGQVKEGEVQKQEVIKKEISRYKTSKIIITILIQPIFIGLVLGLLLIDNVDMMQIIGGSILMLALDGIIVRNLLDPSKKETVEVEVVVNRNNKSAKKEQKNIEAPKKQGKEKNISKDKTNKNKKVAKIKKKK